MDKNILLYPKGGVLTAHLLTSCGNSSCHEAVSRLWSATEPVRLDSFKAEDGWLKPAFSNLQKYALDEGITELGLPEVFEYFAGKHHIGLMIRKAFQSHLGIEMGPAAGLVLDVLLPLKDGKYECGGHVLEFEDVIHVNPEDKGVTCYHRGLLVNVDVPGELVEKVLGEQRENDEFMEALAKLKSPIRLPDTFVDSLKTCTNREV